jgi:hypothetical protein
MTSIRAAAASVLAAGVVLAGGVSPATAAVKITSAHYDAGSSLLTNSNINREYLTIKNTGHRVVRLGGWKIVDLRKTTTGPNRNYQFKAHFRLRPGHTVRLHSGKGRDTRRDLYWGLSRMRWNNAGDSAYLDNRKGKTVSTCTFDPVSKPSPAPC